MSTPPDEPTRRLPPTGAPPPRVREREYPPAEDDGAWLAELHDQVRSLKTAVVLLGVLAVAALAIAAWALLANNDDNNTQTTPTGASSARVSQLEDRVQSLETQMKDVPSKSAVSDLRSQQKDLAARVGKLETAAAQQSDAASKDAVDQIQQDVQDLQQRMDDVEKQQQQQPSATP